MKKEGNWPPPPPCDRPPAPPMPPNTSHSEIDLPALTLRDKVENLFGALNTKVSRQELRIEELENALRYYGDSDNYKLTYDDQCHGGLSANIEYDGGKRARKILYGE